MMIRNGISKMVQKVKIGVVGAPFNAGQRKFGVKDGPRLLRNTGFIDTLEALGHDIIDAGDIPSNDNLRSDIGPAGELNHNEVLTYNKKLSDFVRRIHEENRMCITLGGDHSTAIGTVTGHIRGAPFKQLTVMWIDAHADINTGRTSKSKNMHGMPLAYLLHELNHKVNLLPVSAWPPPCLQSNHLVYIGLRDVEVLEQKFLDGLGILHFGIRDLDKIGLPETIARCLDHLKPSENRSLHMSFDIDALDPTVAASTGTPVKLGLSLREGVSIVEAAQSTGRLMGFDLVEVNPFIGSPEDVMLTAEAAKTLILAAGAGVRS